MILAYDTETTGLPNFKGPSDDPAQPHLVQLAMTMHDDGHELQHDNMIIRPDGWTISPEISKIHGITHERAMDVGVPESHAVRAFILKLAKADMRVAHNESFDRRIMRIAMTRAGVARHFILACEGFPSFCTAVATTPILKLPPTEKQIAAGINTHKTPKLVECMRHFFSEELEGAHDALVDVRACARVYFHLRTLQPGATP